MLSCFSSDWANEILFWLRLSLCHVVLAQTEPMSCLICLDWAHGSLIDYIDHIHQQDWQECSPGLDPWLTCVPARHTKPCQLQTKPNLIKPAECACCFWLKIKIDEHFFTLTTSQTLFHISCSSSELAELNTREYLIISAGKISIIHSDLTRLQIFTEPIIARFSLKQGIKILNKRRHYLFKDIIKY